MWLTDRASPVRLLHLMPHNCTRVLCLGCDCSGCGAPTFAPAIEEPFKSIFFHHVHAGMMQHKVCKKRNKESRMGCRADILITHTGACRIQSFGRGTGRRVCVVSHRVHVYACKEHSASQGSATTLAVVATKRSEATHMREGNAPQNTSSRPGGRTLVTLHNLD
jgi:hypothetical protein